MGQNFHHEVGHTGTLNHTNRINEQCADTPEIDWTYDYNEDGSVDATSYLNPCFDSQPMQNINGTTFNMCNPDGQTVLTASPCCEIENRDNNTMVSGALAAQDPNRAAMTPCQVDRIITNYIDTKCDMLAAVDPPCPPASAYIGILPATDFSQDCKFTLFFEASMFDEEYHLTYEIWENNNWSRLFETDWTDGPAPRRTYGVGSNRGQNGISQTLLSSTLYRITLSTSNECGQVASHSIEFTTGNCDINNDDDGGVIFIPEGNIRVYPNPTNQGSTLQYEVTTTTNVDIWWSGIGTDGHYLPLQQHTGGSGNKTAGTHSVQFSNQQLKQGVNYIVIQAGDEVHVRRLSKN